MSPAQELRLKELLDLRTTVEGRGQMLTRTKSAELRKLLIIRASSQKKDIE